jgi:hypothetical protein
MYKHALFAFLITAIVSADAFAATGNIVVYDDTDENQFNHNAAACGDGGAFFGETSVFQEEAQPLPYPRATTTVLVGRRRASIRQHRTMTASASGSMRAARKPR